MAIGKVRPNKRSSSGSSSYSSTVTTLIVGGLCVYGIYMLSSNDFFSPVTTIRTDAETSIQSNGDDSSVFDQPSHPVKPIAKKSKPVFGDSQGDLPDDAIKNDHHETGHDDHKDEANVDKPEPESENKDDDPSRNNSEAEDQNEKDDSVQELKGRESEEEQKKQKKPDAQTSVDQVVQKKEKSEEEITSKHEEKSSNDEHHENQGISANNKEHEISDEDQQKRLEQHQQQEDDQIQQGKTQDHETEGLTSYDQTEHDRQKPKDQPSGISTKKASQTSNGGSSANHQESNESKKSWSTQADDSENQKERRKDGTNDQSGNNQKWELCNTTAGPDYIPCLDNEKAIAKLTSRRHYEHRERHCPEEAPTCLVPLPKGYKKSVEWPQSRDKIWYHNVPHTKLAEVKGHQNWVKVTGEFLTFPGGGTQFIHGALHYIDFLQEAVPDIAWGKHTRVILDVGCGVASFGGFLFERDVLAMSFAPKDEHEAQVQFALERGIPAISAVMGTQRLPFPSSVFDVVHCARCRVPWHAEGGLLLLELNRVLRPGGYFIWSATPVYQTLEEDVQIWKEMSNLTVAMCWELVTIKKDKLNSVGAAIYHKPDSNDCYEKRKSNRPPMCKSDDDPSAAWHVPLQACMHRVPTQSNERGTEWPEEWPQRVQSTPYWLNKSQMGIYEKPAPEDFAADYEHWKEVINKLYMNGLGINWSGVRNVMDMRAVYGGFAAALKDLKVWVMNVVNIDSPDTLPIIYERGLFGIYHDWCESFSTYPRTYDLLHADNLFSRLKKRCKLIPVIAEVDRIVRPGGKFIMRDDSNTVGEVENLLKSLHWEVQFTSSKDKKGVLSAQKSEWRPDS
ncbi:OLC1v1010960C1 [Oldenlandia corymbosa var. corymbosa]|uniref:OLC1v1010960C1 n=1 Tax=Oldenlandia corymbosa var. corymbosa TaxID=529605 RepID=A0AAV1DT73_OLDCO|nr:OLC1v1010960C1 [Oldenlandia corymbosa var. corymbosa]